MQRWLSGLRRTIGNRVTANTRPEVQILFSAPRFNNPNARPIDAVGRLDYKIKYGCENLWLLVKILWSIFWKTL